MFIFSTICLLSVILAFLIYIHNKEKEHISDEMTKYLERKEYDKGPFKDRVIDTLKKIGLSLLIIVILMVGYLCLYGVYISAKKLYYKSPTLQEEVTRIRNYESTPTKILKEMAE